MRSKLFLFVLISVTFFSSANAWRRRRRRSCDSTSCTWKWGPCDKTCGGGTQRPEITHPAGSCGSCNLPSPRECNTHCCLTNCQWSPWTQFGSCSTTCGCGNQTRTRSFQVKDSCGGKPCTGPSYETRFCNVAPVDCQWGPWSEYGACSATCGEGEQIRSRDVVVTDVCGGSACSGPKQEAIPCNINCCPVDCIWEPWGVFGPCSVSCGIGTKTRVRNIEVGVRGGGEDCIGPLVETKDCVNPDCEIHCDWEPWSNWTECSVSCGGGMQSRTRDPIATDGCNEKTGAETRNCNDNCCSVDCEWNAWSSWSPCTKTCGSGIQRRQRSHKTPSACGGLSCVGNFTEEQKCGDVCCPEDCIWSDWTVWTSCSKPCGSGTQTRHRNITQDQICGGRSCPGTSVETEACNGHGCSVDCVITEWTAWSPCSASCGTGGVSSRTRDISVYPAFNGRPCPDDMVQKKECSRVCLNGGNLTDAGCKCITGWFGGCCDLDVDECAQPETDTLCQKHSTCFNTMGSYRCLCNGGFQEDKNGVCIDINECSVGNHGCIGDYMGCTNIEGSYRCECSGSLEMIDGICLETDGYCEMSAWQPWSGCSATCGGQGVSLRHRSIEPPFSCGAVCKNETTQTKDCNRLCMNGGSLSGSVCRCPNGWEGECCETDIDECKDADGSSSLCADNAFCSNINGSYTCTCKTGFSGDGIHVCESILSAVADQCGTSSICAKNAFCVATPGGHVCSCDSGFTGDGDSFCDDIDECTVTPDICPKEAPVCNNTFGGYRCS